MAQIFPALGGFAFGGDYNPEQWPEDVWAEDLSLMKTAGVNLATVGVFSWAWLETAPGQYEFGWLDRIMDQLAAAGIAVDLATATASPPPWFSHAHPESLPIDRDGRLWHGSRQAICPSSPAYRTAALALVEQLATRYTGHPALAMWHVNNEYGCHVSRCWCDTSAEAFRAWLGRRYESIDELNEAWGTAFWSQRYTDWEQVIPPRHTPTFTNPGQELDFDRFCNDELLDNYRAERDLLHRLSPGVPVTTNFLAGPWDLDYWAWAREVDVVSVDHYMMGEDPRPHAPLAFTADLTRSLAGGQPWMLMEHSTSAVNWQGVNIAKAPGTLRRDSLSHVARGADSVLYFQWRASKAGAEKWHSGMVPHAGADSKVFREITALGAELASIAEVVGSTVVSEAAILLDWQSFWAQNQPSLPSTEMKPLELTQQWHSALRDAGITCDIAHPDGDLSKYTVVFVPALYLVSDAGAANLTAFVEAGGTAVIGPFAGIVDSKDHIRLGGYGAWAELVGVRVQEHFPLAPGATVALSDGTEGRLWTELATATDAETLISYVDGPLAGCPALTRRPHGQGTAYYLTTHLADADLRALLTRATADAGLTAAVAAPLGVDAVRRRHADGREYVFLANHTGAPVEVPVAGKVLTGGEPVAGGVLVPTDGMAVVLRADASE